jgi:pilus assembly protein Flp/PilA
MALLLRLRASRLRSLQLCALRILRDGRGQDLIEYALLAAAIAIIVAGFLPPSVMPSVSTIFSKITSSMAVS